MHQRITTGNSLAGSINLIHNDRGQLVIIKDAHANTKRTPIYPSMQIARCCPVFQL